MENKKAILVVSFGSSMEQARKKAIEPIEALIRQAFPDYRVERAFTSLMIIEKLKRTAGLLIDNPEEGIQKLIDWGATEILVQPLHIIPGFEFEKIERIVAAHRPWQGVIKLGKPLLTDEPDFEAAVGALKTQMIPEKGEAVVLVGHGTDHGANLAYEKLQDRLSQAGLPVYVGTIEGGVAEIFPHLEEQGISQVVLMPFMLVAGDHTFNDMMGEEADSWKNQLEARGCRVRGYMKGLGENPAFQKLYLERVQALAAVE